MSRYAEPRAAERGSGPAASEHDAQSRIDSATEEPSPLDQALNASPKVTQLEALAASLHRGPEVARLTELKKGLSGAIGPASGVVQRTFTYYGKLIATKSSAESLAKDLYERLVQDISEPEMTSKEFAAALKSLAVDGRDHGPLDDTYFEQIITDGQIFERFSFVKKGRRVLTKPNPKANFPPERSIFHQTLTAPEQREDLSYNDLRSILDQVLEVNPDFSEDEFQGAVKAGIDKFDPTGKGVVLKPGHDSDVQTLVQHLLRYQICNLGQTTQNDKLKNEFRAEELEKSKRMMRSTPMSEWSKVLPRDPDFAEGGVIGDALPALIDLNRPLSRSIFGGETYKAVFLLAGQLFKDARERAVRAREEQSGSEAEGADPIKEQRGFFNESLFDLLPKMKPSTIEKGKGKSYLVEQLRLPYKSGEESFEADASSEEEPRTDSDEELQTDPEIYYSGDKLASATRKRSTFLSAFGVFTKVTAQKELLDERTEENQSKFRRMRRLINRRTRQINRRFDKRFKRIVAEQSYYAKKKREIGNKIEAINVKLQKVRRSSEPDTEVIQELEAARERGQELRYNLDGFYSTTTVGGIVKESEGDRFWKKQHPDVFGNLGPKAMKDYLDVPDTQREKRAKPRKRKKKASPVKPGKSRKRGRPRKKGRGKRSE